MKAYIITVAVLIGCVALVPRIDAAEDPERLDSMTLVQRAWDALNSEDYDNAIYYSDVCIRRFGKRAAKMQSELNDYPAGTNDKIHAYYALNDVATALYIKAESLRKSNDNDQAIETYQDLVDNYPFGQCWDPRGWFWKPAVVASEKMDMLRSGVYYDFGDYSSSALTVMAWKALDEEDKEAALRYADKCIELYEERALQMQSELGEFPSGSDDEIHALWALNDVATAYFIKGETYFKSDELNKAREAYQRIIDDFPFAQCWDPRGWFWKVAKGSEDKIQMIDTGLFMDFGDYSSSDLATRAWDAYKEQDYPRALGYANKCIELYSQQAEKMQASLTGYPTGNNEELYGFWALNDVGTAHYIKGRVYMEMGQKEDAAHELAIVKDKYSYAQCWDPKGWWWKVAEDADNWLKTLPVPAHEAGLH